eukprot:g3509.t1
MIFVYLLSGAREEKFWKRVRVRKGLLRAGELLAWGYILQLWVKSWREYLRGDFSDWFYAFHVLQCIGVALLVLILVAWVCYLSRRVPLYIGCLLALGGCLSLYAWMKGLPEGAYFPEGWPQGIQNMFRGKYSVFPVVPWLAFPCLGGALGALMRKEIFHGGGWVAKLWLFLVSFALAGLWMGIPKLPGLSAEEVSGFSWFAGRSAQVVFFLAILRLIEIQWGIGLAWLRRVGQETFGIYIFHVMVLYGGTFGIGLKNWYKEALGPWEAAGGAFVFVSFFAGYAILLNLWKERRRAAKLAAMRPVHAETPIDLEARKESIVTLEAQISEREERMKELAGDILRLDQRTEARVGKIIDKLASVRDGKDSKWDISQTKMDAIEGLGKTIEDYRQRRNELVEKMKEGDTPIPQEVLEGDVEKFDSHIESRVEQIMEISKSFTQEKDVKKYERVGGARHFNGWGWDENIKISEEWRQNRRDKTMDAKQSREVIEALEKAMVRLEQMIAAQKDSLKNRELSATERQIMEEELQNNEAILAKRRGQHGELLEAGQPDTDPLGGDAAHDFQEALKDAVSDLRTDYQTIFSKYAELNRQRVQVYSLKENLEARKQWIADYEAK